MNACKTPCVECPFRKSTPAHMYDSDRNKIMDLSAADEDNIAHVGAPWFGCHMAPGDIESGAERVCAGWLGVVGKFHLGVIAAMNLGFIPRSLVFPEGNELVGSYNEMVSK